MRRKDEGSGSVLTYLFLPRQGCGDVEVLNLGQHRALRVMETRGKVSSGSLVETEAREVGREEERESDARA